MGLYLLTASGGEYDDSWEYNLLASRDRQLLEQIRDALGVHQALHLEAEAEYKKKFTEHMIAWEAVNLDPGIKQLPRTRKPKHPDPPPEYHALLNIPKRERKNHPLMASWKTELQVYETAKNEWNKTDRALSEQETAPHRDWRARRFSEQEAFRTANFHPASALPERYSTTLSKYEHAIFNADHFGIEEVEEV